VTPWKQRGVRRARSAVANGRTRKTNMRGANAIPEAGKTEGGAGGAEQWGRRQAVPTEERRKSQQSGGKRAHARRERQAKEVGRYTGTRQRGTAKRERVVNRRKH